MQIKTTEDPDDYLTKLDNYRSQMKRKPFHHIIKDQDYFIHILNTLPKEYESVVETLERKLGKGTLTISKIKTNLRSKYGRMKKVKKFDDLALFAGGSNNSGN